MKLRPFVTLESAAVPSHALSRSLSVSLSLSLPVSLFFFPSSLALFPVSRSAVEGGAAEDVRSWVEAIFDSASCLQTKAGIDPPCQSWKPDEVDSSRVGPFHIPS